MHERLGEGLMQVRSVAPGTSSTFDDRSMTPASNGMAPSAMSKPSAVRSRRTRCCAAKAAASGMRLS
jgi:hypothetical protein